MNFWWGLKSWTKDFRLFSIFDLKITSAVLGRSGSYFMYGQSGKPYRPQKNELDRAENAKVIFTGSQKNDFWTPFQYLSPYLLTRSEPYSLWIFERKGWKPAVWANHLIPYRVGF